MSESLSELQKLSDEELTQRHDQHAKSTQVGVLYYLEELRARSNARLSQSVERMTRQILVLTAVVTVATIVQLVLVLASFTAD